MYLFLFYQFQQQHFVAFFTSFNKTVKWHTTCATKINLFKQLMSRSWFTVSNAAVRSSHTSRTHFCKVTAHRIWLTVLSKALSVLWNSQYADWQSSYSKFSDLYSLSCCTTTLSINLPTQWRLDTLLYEVSWLDSYSMANRFYLGPGSDPCHPVNWIIPWCHDIFNR